MNWIYDMPGELWRMLDVIAIRVAQSSGLRKGLRR